MVTRPYERSIAAMRDRVLGGAGVTTPALRRSAYDGDVPAELAAYVDKVRRHAYKVTDADVEALRSRYSDDELFEVTVAAALGAAMSRHDAVLRAIREE